MQMALHPTTANLQYVDPLAATSQRATAVKLTIKEVIELAVKLAEAAAAAKEGGTTTPAEPAAKRARQAAAPGSVHPIFKAPANKSAEATSRLYARLGLFGLGGARADEAPPSFEQTAHQEFTKLQAVQAGLSCDDVLMWWKTWGDSYPLLATVASRGVRGSGVGGSA